ncbi:SLC26A/SulP transporter domain [Phytophthora cactorum]|nr:SLC26A/SulP transporter domain [Phytophthora cactorum]
MGSTPAGDIEHGSTPRLSSSSTFFPRTPTPAKPSQYTALEASGAKHSLREHWDESVGQGVRRLARTVRQRAHAPQLSTTDVTDKLPMLLMIPETVAFSYAANLDPLNGLYATGFLGVAVSVFGGVPATVAGAAGAVAMVMPTITSGTGSLAYLTYEERLQHLFVAVTIAGVLELLFGLLKLSKLFSMIPRTAHIGFLNGLALMMFISQKTTIECEIAGDLKWMSVSSPTTWVTIALVLVTMAIMHYFPRTPYIGHLIPPTLVAAVIGVGFEFGINRPLLGYDVRTIGDTSPLDGGLPTFAIPKFGDVQDWGVVLSTAASIMAVGLFESLMTLQSVVDLKKEQLSQIATRKECIAQGIGNVLCGFFSGMGGCSMIAQSNGNILNGARHRLSSFMGGICTFLVVFFASSVIERVPVACLTGILFVIVIHTFYWPSLKLIFRVKITDSIAIILVTVLAAAMNLAIAVISGHLLTFRTGMEEAKIYYVKGQLLFSSVASFREFFDVKHDPNVVIAAMRYRDAGKMLVARNLDPKSLDMLNHDFGWDSVEHIQITTPGTATNGDELVKSKIDKERNSRYSRASQASQGSLHQLHIPSPCESSTPYRAAGP